MSSIDPKIKKGLIDSYLEGSQPVERECRICLKRFVGCSIVCGDKVCLYSLQLLRERNRELSGRPRFDYQATGRKTFLAMQLPDEPEQA